MTDPARIEAAARAIAPEAWADFSSRPKDREIVMYHAKEILAAAYPELANGTAWLAPMDPTPAMMAAMDDERERGCHSQAVYTAMRDAHLKAQGSDA